MEPSSRPEDQPATPATRTGDTTSLLGEARRLASAAKATAREASEARFTASAQEAPALRERSRELDTEANSRRRPSHAGGQDPQPRTPRPMIFDYPPRRAALGSTLYLLAAVLQRRGWVSLTPSVSDTCESPSPTTPAVIRLVSDDALTHFVRTFQDDDFRALYLAEQGRSDVVFDLALQRSTFSPATRRRVHAWFLRQYLRQVEHETAAMHERLTQNAGKDAKQFPVSDEARQLRDELVRLQARRARLQDEERRAQAGLPVLTPTEIGMAIERVVASYAE